MTMSRLVAVGVLVGWGAVVDGFAPRAARVAALRSSSPPVVERRRVAVGGVGELVTGALAEATPVAKELSVYFLKTTIAWGVPAVVLTFVGLSLIDSFRESGSGKKGDKFAATYFGLDDEDSQGATNPLQQLLAGGSGSGQKANRRNAPEYLKVERLNARLESFDFSLQAEKGRSSALRTRRRARLNRAFGDEIALQGLSDAALDTIDRSLTQLQAKTKQARDEANECAAGLRALTLTAPGTKKKTPTNATVTSFFGGGKKGAFSSDKKKLLEAISEARSSELEAELEFLTTLKDVLPDENARVRFARLAALRATSSTGLADAFLLDDPLSPATNATETQRVGVAMRRAYVLKFDGDVTASQVAALREEVTAVLGRANATRGDEVVLRLNSGGGTVTGYGLAAAQLLRLKAAGLRLVICVEQVAASGGYMMSCVADRLVASPFAVLGSIGVISSTPNVYERLKKEGIEFQEITAGEFKRTLTPFKKVDTKDVAKQREDLADIFRLFKSFVATHRPALDIDKVATGETWFGADALALGLCDELKTFDDVTLDLFHDGFDVLSISYADPARRANVGLVGAAADALLAATEEAPTATASQAQRGLLALLARLTLPILTDLAKNQPTAANALDRTKVSELYDPGLEDRYRL